jgi:hypothetical protein
MVWKQEKHNKDTTRRMVHPKRQLFKPILPSSKDTHCSDYEKAKHLSEALKQSLPNALIHDPFEEPETEPLEVTRAATVTNQSLLLDGCSMDAMLRKYKMSISEGFPTCTPEQIHAIERATQGQGDQPIWHELRQKRITASKFHRVHKRTNTYKKDHGIDTSGVVNYLLGDDSRLLQLPAIKHGINLEDAAKKKFREVMKHEGHTDLNISETGIHLNDKHLYLGATPDLLVECTCCGLGLVEIKCPLKCYLQQPTSHNVDCLYDDESSGLTLSKSDKYFTQVQGQLGITGRGYAYFFVYGGMDFFHKEKILFDEEFWLDVYTNLQLFFKDIFLPTLLE